MALMQLEEEKSASFYSSEATWSLLSQINNHLYLLFQQNNGQTVTNPLYVHSFTFLRPMKLTAAEKFNIQYPELSDLTTTADKLRYYRYKKSLLQREIADYAGISRSTYIHYEDSAHDYYPIDKLARIAEFLEVDITDLLDEYNRFLYDGQGGQIHALRKSMGLTQSEFGRLNGVSRNTIKRWESENARITKSLWLRMNQVCISKK